MIPTGFPECNKVFNPHPGDEETVGNLPVYASPRGFNLAVYELNQEEREHIAKGGKLCLAVWMGNQQPPVFLGCYTETVVKELENCL